MHIGNYDATNKIICNKQTSRKHVYESVVRRIFFFLDSERRVIFTTTFFCFFRGYSLVVELPQTSHILIFHICYTGPRLCFGWNFTMGIDLCWVFWRKNENDAISKIAPNTTWNFHESLVWVKLTYKRNRIRFWRFFLAFNRTLKF